MLANPITTTTAQLREALRGYKTSLDKGQRRSWQVDAEEAIRLVQQSLEGEEALATAIWKLKGYHQGKWSGIRGHFATALGVHWSKLYRRRRNRPDHAGTSAPRTCNGSTKTSNQNKMSRTERVKSELMESTTAALAAQAQAIPDEQFDRRIAEAIARRYASASGDAREKAMLRIATHLNMPLKTDS